MIPDAPGPLRIVLIKDRLPYLAVAAGVLLIDRLSKAYIHGTFSIGETRTVIDGFFELTYLQNTGIAFGMLSGPDSGARLLVLSGFAAVAAVVVVAYSFRTAAGERLLQVSLALILGGAVGNLWDRVTIGYVIDFLYFHLGGYYWPAFNAADTAISTGVGLIALDWIRHELRDRA